MLDWIIEGIRVLIWGLTSACLRLMDVCYDIVIEIASADFLSTSDVWGWYYATMSFLGLLIIVRAIAVYFKFAFDEEFREKVSVSNFLHKLIGIVFVILLLPQILGFVSSVSSWGMQNTSIILGTSPDTKPSTLIITAFMNTENGEYNESGEWVAGEKVTYTIEDVDINEDGEGDDDYKFFNEIGDLFTVAIIGIAAAIMLIMNAVQIGKRSYGLVMKLIIAPLPISSLVVPGDETFSMWRKMITSDYLLNFFQTLMIMIIMILSGSKVISDMSVWAQIISFIAGLLMLLSGVPELSKILGGDTSQGSVLQQLASFRMATRGMGHGIAEKAKAIAGTGVTAGAGAGYGIGRLLGGKSMGQLNAEKTAKAEKASENGFMGGNKADDNPGGFASTPKDDGSGNTNVSDSSKVDNHDQSFLNNENDTNENLNVEGGSQGFDTIGKPAEGTGLGGSSTFSDNATQQGVGEAQGAEATRLSRDGTIVNNFANKAATMNGAKGFAANFASNSSRHLYQSSMNRIDRSRAYRMTTSIKQLGSKPPVEGGS
ncbi:hypothetical protein [Breznakia pachnodae]|uniref:Uncharacterized protein n=1 Tax=Breznakia pachnodae TaxID=265178 RepID=A0ABU0E8L9_9FIRM|nr:hypothetical protein [Breznakia pachnodae]MDQ0363243.1 hypothetical protein [Breznakia pachnodae]